MRVAKTPRSEKDVLTDLDRLCSSPGYVHALARISFRDQFLKVRGKIEAETLYPQYRPEVLLRTEISVLIGCMLKSPIDQTLPDTNTLRAYEAESDRLMSELHESMLPDYSAILGEEPNAEKFELLLTSGASLKESIFYGGESAYPFQYFALAEHRYSKDADWLKRNKRYTISEAVLALQAIEHMSLVKVNALGLKARGTNEASSYLEAFAFGIEDLVALTKLDETTIGAVVESFCVSPGELNTQFQMIGDFNICNAKPIQYLGNGVYVSFLRYLLAESVYESPFYWMIADKEYKEPAGKNRGDFAEHFILDRLGSVFPQENIFQNVELLSNRSTIVGEIDILLAYGNRAIIFQAKSKKLTLASRKGSDQQLRIDFQAAIQDAYDQGLECYRFLIDTNIKIRERGRNVENIPRQFDKVVIIPILSENYPSLNQQVRHFLKFEHDDVLMPPLVIDIFCLDVLTEFLSKPLYFLSYLDRRAEYHERFVSTQELTILSYFLKRNLHLESGLDMMMLGDDIASDLDAAMIVRREGWPGDPTPDGILTRNLDTEIGKIVQSLLETQNPDEIELGSFLLSLSEKAVRNASEKLSEMRMSTTENGNPRDMSLDFPTASTGLTFRYSVEPILDEVTQLARYCEKRKYKQKARRWFGISLSPEPLEIRHVVKFDHPWSQNSRLDEETASMKRFDARGNAISSDQRKIGRNEKCPCGSGKKYKYCCGA